MTSFTVLNVLCSNLSWRRYNLLHLVNGEDSWNAWTKDNLETCYNLRQLNPLYFPRYFQLVTISNHMLTKSVQDSCLSGFNIVLFLRWSLLIPEIDIFIAGSWTTNFISASYSLPQTHLKEDLLHEKCENYAMSDGKSNIKTWLLSKTKLYDPRSIFKCFFLFVSSTSSKLYWSLLSCFPTNR